jgi:hypothetical protein
MRSFFYGLLYTLIVVGVTYFATIQTVEPDVEVIRDTVEVDIPVEKPVPVYSPAETVYVDSLIYRTETRIETTYVENAPVIRQQDPEPLGYYRDGEFVQQGMIQSMYVPQWTVGLGQGFIHDWQPTPPEKQIIYETQYITLPILKDPNTYKGFGAGTLVGAFFGLTLGINAQ